MKILHVSTSDRGGAGIASIRLHQSLVKRNVQSKVLLLQITTPNIPNVYHFSQYTPSKKVRLANKAKRIFKSVLRNNIASHQKYLENRPDKFEIFTLPYSNFDITDNP